MTRPCSQGPRDPADDLLEGVDAVIHLAGASIAGRSSAAHKRAIAESRITPTRGPAERAATSGVPVFIGASAIGFYGAARATSRCAKIVRGERDSLPTRARGGNRPLGQPEDLRGGKPRSSREVKVHAPSVGTLLAQRVSMPLFVASRTCSRPGWSCWDVIPNSATRGNN